MLFLDFYQKPYAVSTPLFSPGSTPTWPFNVKPQTRIPKEFADPEILEGFLPTMSFAHNCMLEQKKV